MHRSLDTISEDDEQVRTGSTDTTATEYFDLPEVAPKTRSFDPATIRRQNEAKLALREKLDLQQTHEQAIDETESFRRNVGQTPTKQRSVPSLPHDTRLTPHGLNPRIPRPQDVAYQEALGNEKGKENNQAIENQKHLQGEGEVLRIFPKLAQAFTYSYGDQSRNCSKRMYEESNEQARQTDNSIGTFQVNFDTDSSNSFTLHKWESKGKDKEPYHEDDKGCNMNDENKEQQKDKNKEPHHEDDNDSEQHQDQDKEHHHEEYNDSNKDQTKERDKYNDQENEPDTD
jgi:hypothetical protein